MDHRYAVLEAVFAALSALGDHPPPVFTVTVTTPDDTTRLQWTSLQGEFTPEPPDIEAAILDACTGLPQNAKALARRAGYRYNSYFRDALTRLARSGRVLMTPDGYKLPGDGQGGAGGDGQGK